MDFIKENIIPGEVLVQLVAFLIVFFTLKALAWKPVLGVLEARRKTIKDSFDEIAAGRKEIEQMKAEYAEHLAKIEEEARVKIQDAVDEGRRISKELQEKARQESQSAFDKSKDNLALEVAKARVDLRREIASLSMSVAERILEEKMSDDKKQDEKILGIIEDLEKSL